MYSGFCCTLHCAAASLRTMRALLIGSLVHIGPRGLPGWVESHGKVPGPLATRLCTRRATQHWATSTGPKPQKPLRTMGKGVRRRITGKRRDPDWEPQLGLQKRSPRLRKLSLRAAYIGTDVRTFVRLQKLQVPIALFHILNFLSCASVVHQRDLDFVEYFSGLGEVHHAFSRAGCAAAGYDYCQDAKLQNILSTEGFLNAVQWARRVRAGGHVHMGIVCSSWVWISRSTTRRSEHNPLGDRSRAGQSITLTY